MTDDLANRVEQAAEATEQAYSPHEHRPLRSYAGVIITYSGLLAAFLSALRTGGRELPQRYGIGDLALAALATYRVSRLLSKDTVMSPLRAPFTRYVDVQGPSELHEEVRGTGLRKSVGELLTCPFCTAQWVATAFVGGLAVAPRPTRFIAAIFSTVAVSDLLQFVHSYVQQRAEG